MNPQTHRLIFNKSRGCLMAVGENARSNAGCRCSGGLDDSLCLGHEHYPGDLLRPDGPSTHPVREEPKVGWLSRLLKRK